MPRVVEILKKLTALFLFKIWHLFIKDPVIAAVGETIEQAIAVTKRLEYDDKSIK